MSDTIQSPELAMRLANAIVSDIVLYNEALISKGILEDSLFELLADILQEGRRLYKSRISPSLYEQYNFYDKAVIDKIFYEKGQTISSSIW